MIVFHVITCEITHFFTLDVRAHNITAHVNIVQFEVCTSNDSTSFYIYTRNTIRAVSESSGVSIVLDAIAIEFSSWSLVLKNTLSIAFFTLKQLRSGRLSARSNTFTYFDGYIPEMLDIMAWR